MELVAILIIVGVLVIAEQFLFRRLVLKNVEYRVKFGVPEAFEGETIEIIEEIENRKWLPAPWIKTELSTSRWLEFTGSCAARASDARFVPSVFALKPYQRCVRTRKAVALKRGVYRLESSSMIGGDLLGLVSVSRSIKMDDEIMILPAPYEVGEGELSSRELSGDIPARRFICGDPFLRSGAREYSGREPLNAISWKATARTGKLMAYQNDYTTENRALILINMQRSPSGDLRAPLIADTETMIKAAAFVIEKFAEAGCPTDLAVNCAVPVCAVGGARREEHLKLLRHLSLLENTVGDYFSSWFGRIDKTRFTDIITVTPYIDEELLSIARMEREEGRSMIFFCCGGESNGRDVIPIGRISFR